MTRVEKSTAALHEHDQAIKAGKATRKQLQTQIASTAKEIKEITKRRDQELAQGGKVQSLQAREAELAKDIARVNTKLELKKLEVKDAEDAIRAAEAGVTDVRRQDTISG